MIYVDKLKDLREKRQKTTSELQIIRENIVTTESEILLREHEIRVAFELEVQRAIAEVAKVKYSNAERRKVELDKLFASDQKLLKSKSSLEAFQKLEGKLECDNDIYKFEERYLFKEIEVFITLKNFDAYQLKMGI